MICKLSATTAIVTFLASVDLVAAQTISVNKQTWYGYPDNGGSSTTAYSCDGRGYTAGGSGSFSNPLTFATASDSTLDQPCELFYYPYLEKYLVMQDTCSGCSSDHIDIWIGNGNGGSAEINCEDNFPAGSGHNLIANPGSGEATNTNALWSSSGGCQSSGNYYPNNS